MNWELPDMQAGFRKGIGTRFHTANVCWIIQKAKEFQKSIYFCFIDCAKAFAFVDHNKLWKILKGIGLPDHFTCFLRNLCADQEATVKNQTWNNGRVPNWERSILSPCLFNFYTEYIMWNTGLDESQAGIKIIGRNIDNLRYIDETTLMAESEEERKSFLMKVKEKSEKIGLKLNIQKN